MTHMVKSVSFEKYILLKILEECEISNITFSKHVNNTYKKVQFLESEVERLEKMLERVQAVARGLQQELDNRKNFQQEKLVAEYVAELGDFET